MVKKSKVNRNAVALTHVRKNWMRLLCVYLALVLIGFVSCKKDKDILSNKVHKSASGDPWEDCNATVHPYSLDNIRNAMEGLEINDPMNPDKIFKYVCFQVNNDNERADLTDAVIFMNSLITGGEPIRLFNTPLAAPALYNNILPNASFGMDTTERLQYAIIPINITIPSTVNYVFLDSLYLPDNTEEDLDIGANILAGTIEVDSVEVENYQSPRGIFTWLKKAVNYVKDVLPGADPNGYLRMNGRGLQGTTVEVIAWGIPFSAKTDANGYFHINKRIYVGTIIYLSFENNFCNIKVWNLEDIVNLNNIILTAQEYVGSKAASGLNGMNINLDNNSVGGMCATIVDGISRYRTLASQMGIGVYASKIFVTAIWGVDFSKVGLGSAPLINYIGLLPGYTQNFLMPMLNINTNISAPFGKLLPDILISATKRFDAEDLLATTLHEYTHAAHAQLAGIFFYEKVILGEIANMINCNGDPYGYHPNPPANMGGGASTTPPTNSFNHEVGVAEAWAGCIEKYMMYLITGNASKYINGITSIPGIPDYEGIENHYYNNSDAGKRRRWVPSGLFFDLWDVNGSKYNGVIVNEEPTKNIIDEVSGISWSVMYINLLGTHDFNTYKSKMQLLYPAKKTQIDDLFKSYSF